LNISAVFIERPIATSLLMAGIALFGVIAYLNLPVADLPNVSFPTLVVSAQLPGANPDTMASAVATPLERQFTMIAGLDSIISSNGLGTSTITLQFNLDRNLDSAAVDVQTAIAEATPLLPAGMPAPPSFRKSNPADSPVMFLVVTGEAVPIWVVDDFAERVIAQRISTINGVAQVGVFGAQKYAVHVKVDPTKLTAKRIGMNEISTALQNWNVNLPTGTLYGANREYNVQVDGQLMDAEHFQPLVVAWRNGRPVRLDEVADVFDGVEDERTASWQCDKDPCRFGVNLAVFRQPDSNVIEVNDKIKELVPVFQSQLPPTVHLGIRGDRSVVIREAFKDIRFTMLITMVLVISVIFLFLRNLSATLIPSMALPFSLLGTFAVMYLLEYSLDNLSMMALVLSIGFVVDDAIVMLENIVRHIEHGMDPMEAAYKGSREISFTILSMTISLAAVFIPVLFMEGVLGRLFREFAVTITTAILISGLVSITLTPMLCSRFLRVRHDRRPNFLARGIEAFFEWLHRIYAVTLGWVLRFRPAMLALFFAALGGTAYLFQIAPKGFIPESDIDQMYGTTEGAQGTSYYKMGELQQRVNEILREDPNVESFMSSIGGSSPFNPAVNQGRMWIQLIPRTKRKLSATQIIAALRPKLNSVPGMNVFLTVPPAIRVGGRPSKSAYDLTLSGPDTDELYRQEQILEAEIAKLPGLADVTSDLQIKNPRVNIEVDRDRAASLGINVAQVQNTLYDAFGPRWASTIYAPTNQYKVLLEVVPEYQQHADSLSKIYLRSNAGTLVPLDTVAKLSQDAGPMTIAHSGQLPSTTISFNLRPGFALGAAVEEVTETAARVLPATIQATFQGTAATFQSSLKNLSVLLTIAVMVVYIVLGMLYESYIHPITILSGLPSAAFGALLTLIVFHVDLNIYAFVGLMMLIGIVKKNAIMQIDFALDQERNHGKTPLEAIYEGCLVRFRPIMMTTAAALLSALPMGLGYGSGGEARRPLGLAVVGGLVCSQLMTLYLTPVVYIYMDAIVHRKKRKQPIAPETLTPKEAALSQGHV
jgi:HAE1 family hydrophobic/amphiphilic exporter-1